MPDLIAATGLTGFIGRNLLPRLVARHGAVLSFERYEKITLIQGNKLSTVPREEIKKIGRINLLYNLATYYTPNEASILDAISFVKSNISFPLDIFAEMLDDHSKLINFCSYMQLIEPPSENFYVKTKDYTKAAIERYIPNHCNIFLFDTFGTGDTRTKVVDVFIMRALKGETIKIPSQNVRINLTHIEDICESILEGNNLPMGEYAIHSPNTITILELANLIVRLTNSDSEILHVGYGSCAYNKCAYIPRNIFKSFAGKGLHEQLMTRIQEIDNIL